MSKKGFVYLCIERLLAKCTDRIVCISKAEKTSAVTHDIADDKKLELIQNGVDVKSVMNAVARKRSDLNIPDDAYVIGMIGRLSKQKAPDTFIHAANLIIKEIPNASFMIVGDGEQREEIEQYAKEHGIPLYITGWTDTPYEYLKVFDLAMLLSRWEGFGLAIVEYMAAEKNFIATRVDAIPTIVDDGVDGLLVDMDNAEDVRDKVMILYNDKDLSATLRKNALKKVCENYDISRVAEQHIKMFNDLLKNK